MMAQSVFSLVNPKNENLVFKLFSVEDDSCFNSIQRLNCYSIVFVLKGKGKFKADFSDYTFEKNTLMFFSPHQPYKIKSEEEIKGFAIHFHSDFLCVYKHHKEVACNGILFENIYQPPFLRVEQKEADNFSFLVTQIKTEMQQENLAQYELLVSYLKIFLINATRIKINQRPDTAQALADTKEPFILQKLKDAIEKHYKTKRSASDYADILNISAKALARITKNHFNKTLTNLISERIIIEAKRELYLTSKPVKEIAFQLGFHDEYYFSRFFKTNANVSPQLYRDTIGFAKAEV